MPLGPGSIGPAVFSGGGSSGGGGGTVASVTGTAPIVVTPTTGAVVVSAPHVARKDVVTTQTFDGTVAAPLLETNSALTFLTPGASFRVGTGAPASTLGTTGDFYYNKSGATSACLYIKRSGAWSLISQTTKVTMGGDVTGTSTASTVAKIHGHPVAGTAPTTHYGLFWNGSTWVPASLFTEVVAGTNVTTSTTGGKLKINASGGSVTLGTSPLSAIQLPSVTLLAATPLTVGTSAFTYTNGTTGVGATLTAVSTGVLTVDGVATALTKVYAICAETSTLHNGIYKMTRRGSASTKARMTRIATMNTSAKAGRFITVGVNAGTTYQRGSAFFYPGTNGTFTIGTNGILASYGLRGYIAGRAMVSATGAFARRSAGTMALRPISPASSSGQLQLTTVGTVRLSPGGSYTTAAAAVFSTVTVTSGSAFTPSSTKDSMVYFTVTLAGTLTLTVGTHKLATAVAVVAGSFFGFRVPAGKAVKITLTTATITHGFIYTC